MDIQALADPIKLIIEVIKQTLEETPAELAADLVDTGIVLAGGGALLRGLPDLLSQETELPVVKGARQLHSLRQLLHWPKVQSE